MSIVVLVTERATPENSRWLHERLTQLRDNRKVWIVYLKPDRPKAKDALEIHKTFFGDSALGKEVEIMGSTRWYDAKDEVGEFGVEMFLCVGNYSYARSLGADANIPVLTYATPGPEW